MAAQDSHTQPTDAETVDYFANLAVAEPKESDTDYYANLESEYKKKKAAEVAADLALPFPQRKRFRLRPQYRHWSEEAIVHVFDSQSGSSPYVVTRSNVAHEVLCSPDLAMIDMDLGCSWGISNIHVHAQEQEALSNLRTFAAAHNISLRVYRTAGGLRAHTISAPQVPTKAFISALSKIECVDNLYGEVTLDQGAWRMRLTPKLSRIGPVDYPRWSYYEGAVFPTEQQIAAYDAVARNFKTAELIEVIGDMPICDELKPAVAYHDLRCGVGSSLTMEQPAVDEYVTTAQLADLVAFNEVFRPNGLAPEDVWQELSATTQSNLRTLEHHHDKVFSECRRFDELYHNWEAPDPEYQDFDVLYKSALARYQQAGKPYVWVPNPGEAEYGRISAGHWQTQDEIVHPFDARYWQLDNPSATLPTSSAIIRFLPTRDGQRYVAKKTVRLIQHYVANVLVVADPRHPESNGGVFLFRFGKAILEKINDLMSPPPEFAEMLSADAFDLKTGCTFKLRVCRYDGQPNFAKSSFDAATPVGDDDFIAELMWRVHSFEED